MWKPSIIAASLLLSLPALAIVPASPEITGRVIDGDTNRPIAGALVIARIAGTTTGMFAGNRRNLHCSAVLADANGRFVFPAWKWSVGRSVGMFQMPQYGAIVTAYHADYKPDPDRVFQAIEQFPILETPRTKGGELTISMRRFARDDRTAWRSKLRNAMFWYECDWDADVANTELFWQALSPEVEEYRRLTGDDSPDGPMARLKRLTKRSVTEYQTVIGGDTFSRIEAAKVASAPATANASKAATSARIARIDPDPSKGLRVGESVALSVDVDYEVAADCEIVLVVEADATLLSNTREMLKAGSGRVTLKSDFVVPVASKVHVSAPLALRGGRHVPERTTFTVRRAD